MAEVVLFEDYLGNRLSADATDRLKQVLANDSLARSRFVEVLLEAQSLSTVGWFIRGQSPDPASSDGPTVPPPSFPGYAGGWG